MPGAVRVELGFADHRGLVDPVVGEGLGEYIGGGLVVFDDDVGVVAVVVLGSSGCRHPDCPWGCRSGEARCDRTALGGVAGLGVAEFEMLGHVVDWEPDCACASGDSDAAITMDFSNGPVVVVLDHQPSVGAEDPVVSAGDHLITDEYPRVVDPHGWSVEVKFTDPDPCGLGEPIEPGDGVSAVGHQGHCLASVAGPLPCGDDLGLHLFEGASVEASPLLIFGKDARIAGVETEAGLAFPVVAEPVDPVEFDAAIRFDEVGEHAAPSHR